MPLPEAHHPSPPHPFPINLDTFFNTGTNNYGFRRKLRPLSPSDTYDFSKQISALWPTLPPITHIYSYNSASPYEPGTLIVSTTDGTYEHSSPESSERDPLGPFIRKLNPDGTCGAWSEGVVTAEMLEGHSRENQEATREANRRVEEWKKGYVAKPTLHLRLRWMEGLVERGEWVHVGQYWLARKTPATRTEEQRRVFLEGWREHVGGCHYVDKRCR
ncbi:hypothetical protein BJ508DRAFT_331958 [Ascobolus immersus RN42]|uniref:Uncharacterized protein n=1 Tax=Ascobolus immersus RN42 TaxID=1160509 RepID=A0A3N4HP87_ASCIM|nr:hypothetical protein BJ508DRAFT_331958 [Ascobolus immersus RN42]